MTSATEVACNADLEFEMIERDGTQIVVGLVGAGGFGREVMPLVQECAADLMTAHQASKLDIFFVETDPTINCVNDVRLISEAEFLGLKCEKKLFNIAIANSAVRERLAHHYMSNGVQPVSFTSRTSIQYCNNQIDIGGIICANTIITSNAIIGKFFHANIYSYVAHDCVVGDYVTFAPNVHCNGNVHIGDHAYLGTGAMIKEGSRAKPRVIGQGAIIGMGAVVTKDVPPYSTVVGNPARILDKNSDLPLRNSTRSD